MLKEQLAVAGSPGSRSGKSLKDITVDVSRLPGFLPIGATRAAFAYSKAREVANLAVVGMDTACFERDRMKEKNRKLEEKARKQAKRIAYLEKLLGSVPPPEDEQDAHDGDARRNAGTLFSSLFVHLRVHLPRVLPRFSLDGSQKSCRGGTNE